MCKHCGQPERNALRGGIHYHVCARHSLRPFAGSQRSINPGTAAPSALPDEPLPTRSPPSTAPGTAAPNAAPGGLDARVDEVFTAPAAPERASAPVPVEEAAEEAAEAFFVTALLKLLNFCTSLFALFYSILFFFI